LPPETTTYAWDNENRLIEVDKAGAVHRYEYDYRTRRISREEPPAGGGAAVKTAVVFAGGLSVAEYVANAATPTVEYVRGPDLGGGVGGMLYTLRPEGGTLAAKFSYANGRGDVVAQANQGGTVTWTASYEAFGTRKLETGTNADRQRANTKEEDPTGLLNEGFRYRDLETGTWLSRDPAGFVDGPNLYAYVRCNPWSKFDPLGLWEAVPVPTDASFRQKMAATWENVQRGFGALPSELGSGFKQAMSNKAIATTFAVSNAPMAIVGGYQAALAAMAAPLQAYAMAEVGSTVAEIATGYDGPPLIPGPGDVVRGAIQAQKAMVKGLENVVETKTVGRWMGDVELQKMQETKTVQESYSRTTHVVDPANPDVFRKQDKSGANYTEFDVPASSVKPTGEDGVSKIVGPNSLEGRNAKRKGQPEPQMPEAQNIVVKEKKG